MSVASSSCKAGSKNRSLIIFMVSVLTMAVVALSPEHLLCMSNQLDARMVELRIICGCESIDGNHLDMVESEANARIPTNVNIRLRLEKMRLTLPYQIQGVKARILELW